MNTVQEIVNKITNNNFSYRELEQYLDSSLVLIKTNAIIAVLKNSITEKDVVCKLDCISQNIEHEPKVFGEWTTGHYAMATLNLLNTKETKKLYNDNLIKLDECTKESIKKLMEQIIYILE